jgi:hypothetical protein
MTHLDELQVSVSVENRLIREIIISTVGSGVLIYRQYLYVRSGSLDIFY